MRKAFDPTTLCAFDTETTGLFPWLGDLPFAYSFCNENGETLYYEWDVDPWTRDVMSEWDELDHVREILEDESVVKVAHNLKFDTRHSEVGFGIMVAGPGGLISEGGECHETVFSSHACKSDEHNYKLKKLAAKYVDIAEDDLVVLKKWITRLRRKARTVGWALANAPDKGGRKKKSEDGEGDYWLPRAAVKYHPEWFAGPAQRKMVAGLCRRYAVTDARRTMLLHLLQKKVMKDLDVTDTYEREMALWPATYRMEGRGMTLYRSRLRASHTQCERTVETLYKEITSKWGWAGMNLKSPHQVAKMLYGKDGKLRLVKPILQRSKNKKTSKLGTDATTLQYLVNEPAVAALLRYRANEKAIDGFFKNFWRLSVPVDPTDDGRENCRVVYDDDKYDDLLVVHPGWRQVGPKTGRWACGDPNAQQASSPESSRHGTVISVREPFGPRPGYWWLSADYSGMEIRVFADVADETSMLEAIWRGEDVHSLAVQKIYGGEGNPLTIKQAMMALNLDNRQTFEQMEHDSPLVAAARKELGIRPKAYSQKDAEKLAAMWLHRWKWDIEKAEKSVNRKNTRARTKMVSFLKVYGGGALALALVVACSLEDAKETLREYDRMFPRIREYAKELQKEARRNGYVMTRWGRRLTVDPDKAYKGVNYVVQGSCADLLKHAMLKCDKFFRQHDLGGMVRWGVQKSALRWTRVIDGHVIAPIHDELVFEILRRDCTIPVVQKIDELMSDSDGHLRVSMPVTPLLIKERWDVKVRIKGYPYKEN